MSAQSGAKELRWGKVRGGAGRRRKKCERVISWAVVLVVVRRLCSRMHVIRAHNRCLGMSQGLLVRPACAGMHHAEGGGSRVERLLRT